MCVLRFSYAMMEVTDESTGVLHAMPVRSTAACKPKHHDGLNCKCCAQRVNMSQVTQSLLRDRKRLPDAKAGAAGGVHN